MIACRTLFRSICFSALLLLVTSLARVSAQTSGPLQRVTNTTLRLPTGPPQLSYVTTNAFPGLTFTDPVAITAPPGETNRLFVVEQRGRVIVITNLMVPTRTVFLDISNRVSGGVPSDERGLLGLAFHPGFATNRQFFVYYSRAATTPVPGGTNSLHQRLARFEVSPDNPAQALLNSEAPLLTMRDEASNHNGGDLHFGPEGYLYVSLGDEGGGNDSQNNSQILDKDFWSSILRLDVDLRPENLEPNPHPAIHPGIYRVPADNPFVGVTNWYGSNLVPARVRTEFYAIGMRNPWRMSFDRATGHLYCGDVGQNAREEIDIIVKGGNYGWAFREGAIAGPKPTPPNPRIINPILDYTRGNGTNQGTSVSGGVVYRGRRLPDLDGAYVFADYVSGNIWSLRYDGTNASQFRQLARDTSITAFGLDPRNGDVLLADANDDQVKRLEFGTDGGGVLPPTLAGTGAFTNLATLTPHAGIVDYDVSVPSWTDGAHARRWFYIPARNTMTFRAAQNWSFPTGSVWIQHFELELTNGVPESRRRVETRFLVRDTAAGVFGFTYRWDNSQTNATLVADGGFDEAFTVQDSGTVHTQVWHYPGRGECLRCHTTSAIGGMALGFNTPQLNRDYTFANGFTDNQLRALNDAGYFGTSGPNTNLHLLRALAHPTNESVSVEQRVRSHLAVHCAPCHQPGGPGRGQFDTRIFSTLPQTRLILGALLDTAGNPNNVVVAPGSLENSRLLQVISTPGSGRMPPVGGTQINPYAVALVSDWITNGLASYRTFAQWQTNLFGDSTATNALADADPDADGARNSLEYLIGSDPLTPGDAWSVRIERAGEMVEIVYPRFSNRGFEVQTAETLGLSNVWLPLNAPENRPFFSSTNGPTRVPIATTNSPTRFHRVRVFEP